MKMLRLEEPAAAEDIETDACEKGAVVGAVDGQLAAPARWEAPEQDLEFIYAFIYRRVGNREDAEDLTQDVALKVLPRLQRDRPLAAVRAYLVATARSVLAGFWSQRLGMPLSELHEELEARPEEVASSERAPIEVERLLARLPAHYRRLLELRFLRGYSLKEVAAELGTTLGGIKVMQLRALRAAARVAVDG